MQTPPKPMCFVAMPYGKKSPTDKDKLEINFDIVYEFVRDAVLENGLECVRADEDPSGGLIQKPMYESLLVAEYVIADVTFANPNVMYEVGVRHGCLARATLLIGAERYIKSLPFDLKPMRVLLYQLNDDGAMTVEQGNALKNEINHRLQQATTGKLPLDNPILQLISLKPSSRVEHEKIDAFLPRIEYASAAGERIEHALRTLDRQEAVSQLKQVEHKLLAGPQVVNQLHSALLSLYIAFREKKAYDEMVQLYQKLPPELQRTPVAIEQLAFAQNRMAEGSDAKGNKQKAQQFRLQALDHLHQLPRQQWTSETYGIAGRIYKAQFNAARESGDATLAKGALEQAIETYELGFRSDMRDYYPGVNAVTLRLTRNSPKDREALKELLPAVRFSVHNAPHSDDPNERYWQEATKLELACAAGDWQAAHDLLANISILPVQQWMLDSTSKNLHILKQAFSDDAEAVKSIDNIIKGLHP